MSAFNSGFEKTDEHDAAFAVYTNGTTGNPKGVLHEYGNLDRMIDSTTMRDFPPIATREDRFALVAPVNDMQKSLCDAFAKVLQLKRVGIKDDFYELDGDSLASMEVLAESKIKGLTTADIFAAHTPEAIAERYKKEHPQGVTESDEECGSLPRYLPRGGLFSLRTLQ